MYISKRSTWITQFYLQIGHTPCPPFLRKRSPDGATRNWYRRHPIAAYYSSIRRDEMLSWPGWLTYSGRYTRHYPHKWSSSPTSYRSSAGQGKFAGQRPTFHAVPHTHSPSVPTLEYHNAIDLSYSMVVDCRLYSLVTAVLERRLYWFNLIRESFSRDRSPLLSASDLWYTCTSPIIQFLSPPPNIVYVLYCRVHSETPIFSLLWCY